MERGGLCKSCARGVREISFWWDRFEESTADGLISRGAGGMGDGCRSVIEADALIFNFGFETGVLGYFASVLVGFEVWKIRYDDKVET